MAEVEDGGGPLEQDPAREHGYHPTLESSPINKKVSRVSNRHIHRLERRANIHNPPPPTSIVQVGNHLTIAYHRYYK